MAAPVSDTEVKKMLAVSADSVTPGPDNYYDDLWYRTTVYVGDQTADHNEGPLAFLGETAPHEPDDRERFETVSPHFHLVRQFQVFVDYAHTPDALGNVLKTLRELEPERLIAVFGCGGDRDRQKRPLMAEMADRLADYSIITSDNPRKEDPIAIITETEKGFRSNRYEKIVDRTQAIDRAVALARPRDIVLIAGKGHENYQEFGDYTIPFDDIQVARRAIENHPVEFLSS